MKIISLFVISIFALLSSNFDRKNETIENLGNTDFVVVIFEKATSDNPNISKSFFTPNHILYFDESNIPIQHNINNNDKNDTLTIPLYEDVKNIEFFYNYIRFQYNLFKGDTVLFTFPEDIPEAISLVKNIDQNDMNFHKLVKIELQEPLKDSNRITQFVGQIPTDKEKLAQYNETLENEYKTLNNLKSLGTISEGNYNFMYDYILAQYYHKLVKLPLNEELLSLEKQGNVIEFIQRKELLGKPYFHHFLKFGFLTSNMLKVRFIQSNQSRSLDYKDAYNKIKNVINEESIRDWMLYYCVDQLGTNGTKNDFQSYFKHLQNDVSNFAYIHELSVNHLTDQVAVEGENRVTNYDGTLHLEFAELLQSYKGKLVYVDFWASWCMPCRAAMPASKKLNEEFESKGVRFVYLSLDQKSNEWRKAVIDEKLEKYSDSYLLLNPRESEIVKTLGINTIPRYIVFDKDGNLLHKNAPGPDSEEIREIFLKYL